MVFIGTCVLLPLIISTCSALSNVFCTNPLPTVVPVDPQHHNFFPYFVTLNRCQGSVNHEKPTVKRCASKSSTMVKIDAFSPFLGVETEPIYLRNDTSCKAECVSDASSCHKNFEVWNPSTCACDCKYPSSKGPCPNGFRWNSNNCRCRCNKAPEVCDFKKEWSNELCRCTCSKKVIKHCADQGKNINNQTCSCMDTGAVGNTPEGPGTAKTHLYITLLVIEAVVIIVLICVLIHWIRKKKGYHDRTRNKYHGSKEPLTPRGTDIEDGRTKYTSKDSFEFKVPPKEGADTKSTAAKQKE